MKCEILHIKNYSDDIINKIVSFIKKRKIIIMPSDTIYGFLALPQMEKRLRKIKKREEKPFLYLIDILDKLNDLGIKNNYDSELFNKYWPGPFTFILDNDSDGRGVRMPDFDALREIVKEAGSPLISTSVNYSGQDELNDIKAIISEFQNKVDLIVSDESFKSTVSSAIVDLRNKPYKILRKGSKDFND